MADSALYIPSSGCFRWFYVGIPRDNSPMSTMPTDLTRNVLLPKVRRHLAVCSRPTNQKTVVLLSSCFEVNFNDISKTWFQMFQIFSNIRVQQAFWTDHDGSLHWVAVTSARWRWFSFEKKVKRLKNRLHASDGWIDVLYRWFFIRDEQTFSSKIYFVCLGHA